MNQQSFWQKYVMGMLALHPRTCASNGYSDIMDVAECKSAAIEVGFVGENANNPHRQSENDRPHGCRRQTFGPALWINDNPNSPTTASDVHSVVCKAGTARFAMSEPGHNCHDACSSIDEECREDMLFPQSADEVLSWALEVGVVCTSIVERCDMGESPIFTDGLCTFCNNPNHPGWGMEFFGNHCQAQWHDRERICPCTSSTDKPTNMPTRSPNTSIPSMNPSIQPSKTPSSTPTNTPTFSPMLDFIQVSGEGTCESLGGHSTIMDPALCEFAAEYLGKIDTTVNIIPRHGPADARPAGCTYHHFQNLELWTEATGVCTFGEGCICVKKPRFAMSEPGHNCHDACSSIEEECREDMLFPQSADEVLSWALEVGVVCTSIVERCDMGESPIFTDGLCTFCNNPNHPGWGMEFFGNRCQAQWHHRERICPCTSTSTDMWTNEPINSDMWTNEPTEFLAEGIEGSVCETDDDCDSSRCNLNELPHRCREKEGHSSDCTKNSDCLSDLCWVKPA